MPLQLGFLQRAIKVHWGGGRATFVIGTYKGSLYSADPKSADDIEFNEVALPVSGIFPNDRGFFHLSGSSCGLIGAEEKTPLFLVCGMGSELSGLSAPDDLFKFFAFICSSEDGLTWQQVYKGPAGTEFETFIHPWGSESNALVWKPDDLKFYYSMLMNKSTGSNPFLHEQIFSSTDGSAWSGPITDRSVLTADNGGMMFQSDFPSNYCDHNEGFDERNQHVPDGVMSTFSETKTIAMCPEKPPVVYYTGGRAIVYWPEEPTNAIKIMEKTDTTITTSIKTIPGITQVTAVGGNGSTWMAGGWNDEDGKSGAIAFSFDTGDTWVPGPAVDSGVITLAWAPVSDAGL